MTIERETEKVEFKRSTSEMREGMESIASILNKHGRVDERGMVRSSCMTLPS